MKFLPSRGTFPQLKDFDMRHVLKAMVPGISDTWKSANIFHFPSSLFTNIPVKGKPGSYQVDINTLQPLIELSRFYSRAFGKNTPVKLARRMMEKLRKKGFIEVSERQINIGLSSLRRSKQWKLRYYQITYKGFMYLQTPPNTRFDLFNPKSAKSFQAYLRKCKEEDDSRAFTAGRKKAQENEEAATPITPAAAETLKAMQESRERLLDAIGQKRLKVEQLSPPRRPEQIILSRLTHNLIQIISEKGLQEILFMNSRLPAAEPHIATQQIIPFIVEDETGTSRCVAVMGDKAFVIADYDEVKPKPPIYFLQTGVKRKVTEIRYYYPLSADVLGTKEYLGIPRLQICCGKDCCEIDVDYENKKPIENLLDIVGKQISQLRDAKKI